jgi:hypothetical protein
MERREKGGERGTWPPQCPCQATEHVSAALLNGPPQLPSGDQQMNCPVEEPCQLDRTQKQLGTVVPPVIPALGRLRQEDLEFQASLGT